MDQIGLAPPPLPPKTRARAPTQAATVPLFYPSSTPSSSASSISSEDDSNNNNNNHVVKIRITPDDVIHRDSCIRISVNHRHHEDDDMVMQDSFLFSLIPHHHHHHLEDQQQPQQKKTSSVSVTVIKRASSLTDSDGDNDSSISCDSLNHGGGQESPVEIKGMPPTLLQDIRSAPLIRSYEERQEDKIMKDSGGGGDGSSDFINTDMFYKFHLNEKVCEEQEKNGKNDCGDNRVKVVEDETFAGFKDILGDGASTIRSAKGTVRGVKNRVRAGIATFLQINSPDQNYKEKDAGKVVVYTTTMGVLRETYHACMKVKQILRTLLIKFEERDVFMSGDYQVEIKERMKCDHILVPQVYVDGQHMGDAETIERLNESGELRRILKPFKSPDACSTCQTCGGYRLLPCPVCSGSKKSVHRNHFTTEFVALKCMNCDEVGLVKCTAC